MKKEIVFETEEKNCARRMFSILEEFCDQYPTCDGCPFDREARGGGSTFCVKALMQDICEDINLLE